MNEKQDIYNDESTIGSPFSNKPMANTTTEPLPQLSQLYGSPSNDQYDLLNSSNTQNNSTDSDIEEIDYSKNTLDGFPQEMPDAIESLNEFSREIRRQPYMERAEKLYNDSADKVNKMKEISGSEQEFMDFMNNKLSFYTNHKNDIEQVAKEDGKTTADFYRHLEASRRVMTYKIVSKRGSPDTFNNDNAAIQKTIEKIADVLSTDPNRDINDNIDSVRESNMALRRSASFVQMVENTQKQRNI